jgi:trehalose 6-phosphate phosphatase
VRNVLSPLQERKLLEFLETRPILAFDYDGTLAPIVKDASQAKPRPETRQLLTQLCEHYTCALLTGRARKDVLRHLDGIPFAQVLGNHGAEWGESVPGEYAMTRQVKRWLEQLERSLAGLQGVHIEDKGISLSIHYRKARRKEQTLERIQDALKPLRGLRVIGGKQVVNVLPKQLGGKGQALRQLKKFYGAPTALFAGDDLNDEEVFTLPERERVFKIRVEKSFNSKADFFIPHQSDMESLLSLLLRLAPSSRRQAAS